MHQYQNLLVCKYKIIFNLILKDKSDQHFYFLRYINCLSVYLFQINAPILNNVLWNKRSKLCFVIFIVQLISEIKSKELIIEIILIEKSGLKTIPNWFCPGVGVYI